MFLILILTFFSHVNALRFIIRGQHHLNKRGHVSGLDNGQNLKYYTKITLGGMPFSVRIDTGSSDLWVAGNLSNSINTGVSTGVEYAVGAISGSVRTAQLTFLNFVVPDQAFIQVPPSSVYPEGQGLIGLGPNVGSNIHSALKGQPKGDAVLDRIFRQDPSTPNILTVLLSRSNNPTEQYPGEITVSDIITGFENITTQPQLTVKTVPSSRSGNQHWQVLLDPNGIIGPDGQPIAISTKVSSTQNPSRLTAVFDTGFTFNQVPKTVADAIYSHIPGAKFQNLSATGPVYTLPCDAEVNSTVLFGNKSFPIHPLDMSFNLTNSPVNQTCVGGFQPITTGAAPDYDMILGMAFLRNAYLLINYGNYADGARTRTPPYVQLLSITDPTVAHQDFVSTRLGGIDTTGMQRFDVTTPASKPDNAPKTFDRRQKLIAIIGVVAGSVFLLVVAVGVFLIYRRRRTRRLLPGPDFSTVDAGLSYGYAKYHPLQHAAPPGEAHPVQG